MRERIDEADPHAHPACMAGSQPGEPALQGRVAVAEDRDLHAQLHEVRCEFDHEVHALLPVEAGHHAEQRHVAPDLEAELMLQRGLREALRRQTPGRVRLGEIGIHLRRPVGVIRAVQDAVQLAGRCSVAKHALEAEPERRRLDLARVPR